MEVALWSQIRQIMQACRGDIVSGSGSHRRGWLPLKLRQEDHFVGSVSVYSFSPRQRESRTQDSTSNVPTKTTASPMSIFGVVTA